MFRIIAGIQARFDEPPNTFARRAARAVAHLQPSAGLLSVHWATHIVQWAAHVVRNTKCASWLARLLDINRSAQLDARFRENNNRPGSRRSAGWLSLRWTDSVKTAFEHLESQSSLTQRIVCKLGVDCADLNNERIIASFIAKL